MVIENENEGYENEEYENGYSKRSVRNDLPVSGIEFPLHVIKLSIQIPT